MVVITLVLDGVRKSSYKSLASDDMKDKDFKKYDRAMRIPTEPCSCKETIPRNCKECEYHRPRWKYRSCYFARCYYQITENAFRAVPLQHDPFQKQEVVKMDGI